MKNEDITATMQLPMKRQIAYLGPDVDSDVVSSAPTDMIIADNRPKTVP